MDRRAELSRLTAIGTLLFSGLGCGVSGPGINGSVNIVPGNNVPYDINSQISVLGNSLIVETGTDLKIFEFAVATGKGSNYKSAINFVTRIGE